MWREAICDFQFLFFDLKGKTTIRLEDGTCVMSGGSQIENLKSKTENASYDPDAFWNARLDKDFSLSGVGHTSVGLAFNRWAYKVRRRVLLRQLTAHNIPVRDTRILELAFGTGYYLDLWRELGAAHVFGMDIAHVAVRAACERFAAQNWRFEQGDIGKSLPSEAPAASFDLATAFDVLFHLVEDVSWNGALDNLAAALKPGGYAVIFDKFQKQESAGSHVRRRTLAHYHEALERRGFEIQVLKPIFFVMNSPTDLEGISGVFWRLGWSLAKLPYKVGKPVGLGEAFGACAGAALYGPELLMGHLFSSGPSTKVLIAKRR